MFAHWLSAMESGTVKCAGASYRVKGQSIFTGEAKLMRLRTLFPLPILFLTPLTLPAQVTHGQKPQLPAPFATKSAGNGPTGVKPPAGFLPQVPPGFRVNIFATNFRRPRWLTVAPNGDVFLADTGSGEIIVMRDPQNAGGAQQREVFVSGMKRPFGIAFREDYVYI